MGEALVQRWGTLSNLNSGISFVRRALFSALFAFGLIGSVQSLHAENCKGLLYQVAQIQKEDFHKKDNSLPHIITNSLIWLAGVDAARMALGLPAFDSAFVSNTVIDATATAVGHQVSMGNVPKKLKKHIEGRENYNKRTWINTSMAMAITMAFWAVAAAQNDAPVGDALAWLQGDVIPHAATAMVFGLTWGIYKIHPFSKDWMFRKLPLDRDKAKLAELESEHPEKMQEIRASLEQRATELGLSEEQGGELAITLLELARASIDYENTLSSDLLKSNRSLRKLAEKIQSEDDLSKKRKLRKKLISKLLKIHKKHPEFKSEIENVLDLGQPFTKMQSLELHRSLGQHQFKQWAKLGFTAFIDQAIWVGLAGGVIFRAITEFAIH